MNIRRFLRAMAHPMSIITAIAVLILTFLTNSIAVFGIGLLFYLVLTISKLGNKEFSKVLDVEETVYLIKRLNYECEKLAESTKNSTNAEKRYRVREVLKDKDEVMTLLLEDKERLLKQKVAKQTIELAMVYIKLLENYYLRLKEVENTDLKELEERIKNNKVQIEKIDDIEICDDLQNLIELDTKVIERIAQEKEELSKINSKLNCIESSINLLKQQMTSEFEEEDILNSVSEVVNEAVALDNVLSQRRKERNRI